MMEVERRHAKMKRKANTKPSAGKLGINTHTHRYLAKMLRLAQLDDGDVFLDMGSGTGKAVVAAGLLYPKLSVCRGVEILEGLHQESKVCLPVRPRARVCVLCLCAGCSYARIVLPVRGLRHGV